MTAPLSNLIRTHRLDLNELLRMALGELSALFRSLTGVAGDPYELRDALAAELHALGDVYAPAAATLGADWYDEVREAAQVSGRFRAIPADQPDPGRIAALAGWATQPLFQAEPEDLVVVKERVEGSFIRYVADMDRDTVMGSLRQDTQGQGWRRVVSSNCQFCNMIAARGAVYSAETANFASHDNCKCIAVPVFGEAVEVKPYTPSQRFRSDAQREANNTRIREYLRDNPQPATT